MSAKTEMLLEGNRDSDVWRKEEASPFGQQRENEAAVSEGHWELDTKPTR